jgi:chaperone required for assembly of F1-ATPase
MGQMRSFQRFYTEAIAEPHADGHAVTLDGRPVKTPGVRAELTVPTRPLAEAIAGEWADQGEQVDPRTMPLTALACTAHDVAIPRRDELVREIARYADTDLVCYRAPQPQALAEREQAVWQPLMDWLALQYDARLNTTTGILPIEQPAPAKRALARAVEGFDAMHLAALSSATHTAGSLVVGLALVEGRLSASEAFDAAEVERTYQIEQWGEDTEAASERATLKQDLDAVERFVGLLAAS